MIARSNWLRIERRETFIFSEIFFSIFAKNAKIIFLLSKMKFRPSTGFFAICILSLFLGACNKKPVACLYHSGDNTTKINSKFTVSSCGRDYNAIVWFVDGGGETILKGGGNCDKSITVKFSTTGEKTIRITAFKFKKKSKGDCQNMSSDARKDEEIYTIKVE